MIQLRTAKRFAALTLSASALAIVVGSSPAAAQTTDPAPAAASNAAAADQAAQVQADGAPVAQAAGNDIVVTGSRIPQPNLTGISPVTVINSAEVGLQGTTRVEDLLNSLPQSFASQGGNIANGATGTATVNLRNLGSSRTLVLINGRRLLPGDPGSPVADINFVPAQLIKRVDVLTGGASSVYGSDAVAGVVNFVLDTDFEGLKATAQYSFFDHNNHADDSVISALNRRGFGYPGGHSADGGTVDASLTFGAAFGDNRGHVTAFAGYRKLNAITQGDRDYSSCALAGGGSTAFSCGGSSTSATGRFFTNFPNDSFTTSGNSFAPFSQPFNYAPYNYFQRPDERYTAGAFADYEVTPAVHPYMEAMFMDDRTVAQIAPSGDFGNTFQINCNNPLLSAQQIALVCKNGNFVGQTSTFNPDGSLKTVTGTPTFFTDANGNTYNQAILQPLRRNVEGGGRQDDLQHTDYRIVAGIKGNINDAFSYDAYYQYGRVVYAETYFNDFSVTRLGRSLDVINVNGVPTCQSVVNGSDPACVPYDIFSTGGVTQGALNYLQTPGFQRGNTQEQVFNASVTALLGQYGIKSPFANDGLGINVGYEYRKESLTLNTDQAFTSGDLAGQGGATIGVSGGFKVNEGFVEARLPIIEDKPFFRSLSVEGGYRRSKYDNGVSSFTAESYKGAADWEPFSSLRLRAGYNRAVRAPNAVELFRAQSVALDGATDPCAGTVVGGLVNGFTPEQCARTGVTASQFGNISANSANQYNGLLGGNPNLRPEKADTYTAGVVFTPTVIRNFSLTADYFDIKINDQIGVIGADTILQQCLNNNILCQNIVRDQFGSLYRSPNGYVVDTNLNSGAVRTNGIDFGANYGREFGIGRFAIDSTTTYLISYRTEPVGSNSYDCAGLYGTICGTPLPKWRAKTRLTYTSPNGIGLSGQWRYFGPVNLDTTNGAISATPTANNRIGAQSYFDLAMTARVTDAFSLRIGVNNLLDRDPPVRGGQVLTGVFGSGNTFPQVYDYAGRYIFSGVTLNF